MTQSLTIIWYAAFRFLNMRCLWSWYTAGRMTAAVGVLSISDGSDSLSAAQWLLEALRTWRSRSQALPRFQGIILRVFILCLTAEHSVAALLWHLKRWFICRTWMESNWWAPEARMGTLEGQNSVHQIPNPEQPFRHLRTALTTSSVVCNLHVCQGPRAKGFLLYSVMLLGGRTLWKDVSPLVVFPPPPSSCSVFCFVDTTYMATTICTSSPQVQKQQSQLSWDRNVWNWEQRHSFPSGCWFS